MVQEMSYTEALEARGQYLEERIDAARHTLYEITSQFDNPLLRSMFGGLIAQLEVIYTELDYHDSDLPNRDQF